MSIDLVIAFFGIGAAIGLVIHLTGNNPNADVRLVRKSKIRFKD